MGCGWGNSVKELPSTKADPQGTSAVTAQHTDNAHRALLHSVEELKLILCRHHQRKLSKNLTLSFCNTEYQLTGSCALRVTARAIV